MKFLQTLALFLKYKAEELWKPVLGFTILILFCWGDKWLFCDYLNLTGVDAVVIPLGLLFWVLCAIWAKTACVYLYHRLRSDVYNYGSADEWMLITGIYAGFITSAVTFPWAAEMADKDTAFAGPFLAGILASLLVGGGLLLLNIFLGIADGTWKFIRSNWDRAKWAVEHKEYVKEMEEDEK